MEDDDKVDETAETSEPGRYTALGVGCGICYQEGRGEEDALAEDGLVDGPRV